MVVAFAARRVKKRACIAVISRLVLLLLLTLRLALALTAPAEDPVHGQALARSRVVIVEDQRAVIAFNPSPEIVDQMVTQGIVALTLKETPAEAWRTFFTEEDTIGIKVLSAPGATSGTRPVVVAALVKSMLTTGLRPDRIIIWDKRLTDLRHAGFTDLAERLGVRVAGSADEGYDPDAFYESPLLGNLVWGDFEFGKKSDNLGRKSFVSKLLTRQLTKIINVSPLLNHNFAGVSGNLFSLSLGSIDNSIRFEAVPNPTGQLSETVPELYAMREIGDRVVLNIVDALICQYQGEDRMLLHYSTMLNQLRFSKDPVALDVLSLHELERQRQRARLPTFKINEQMYTNAALLQLGTSDLRLIDVVKLESSTGKRADQR